VIYFAIRALQKIVPPVLNSFTDQDSRVRYYACEALYNIAKVNLSSIFTDFSKAYVFLFLISILFLFFIVFFSIFIG